MTSTNRRSGFRLPWSADADDKTDAAAPETTEQATATTEPEGDAAVAETAMPQAAESVSSATPAQQAAVPKPAPAGSTSDPFLQNLVDVMRHVAEEARDRNLSELRTLVEKRVEQVGERGTERADDLRRRSELDIKGIGDWERSELERVRAEAQRKVEARRKQLEQQLRDHQQGTEAEVEAVRTRLAEHERELDAFFAQLAEIKDPTAFVSAAKRMPAPPSLDVPASDVRTVGAPDGESLTSRLAMLGIDKQQAATSANGSSAAETQAANPSLEQRLAQLDQQLQPAPTTSETGTEPAGEEPADKPATTTTATAPVPADATGEASTAIVVKGLGSFGAITSFKQSLEKVEGIRSVTLSLGPTGEFVYRAAHDPGFDLEGVIATLEGGSAELERQSDGTLRVTVNRSR